MLERSMTGEFTNGAFYRRQTPRCAFCLQKIRWISFHIKKPCNTSQLADASETEETDVEDLLESLEKKVGLISSLPKCIASKVCYLLIVRFPLESGPLVCTFIIMELKIYSYMTGAIVH